MLRQIGRKYLSRSNCLVLKALSLTGLLVGCSNTHKQTPLTAPYSGQVTIAVAPVLNYSGTAELDTLKVTDILFSELQQVEGLAVVPVNRVLAQMAQDGTDSIQSPQQAVELAEKLGAQAIVVAAITEYSPYYPPVVGVALQLYGFGNEDVVHSAFDPVTMERLPSPMKVHLDLAHKYWPKSQVLRIYNSRDRRTVDEVKQFAKERGTGTSPYEWELYLRTQTDYLRFVSHRAIRELLEQEMDRINETFLSDRREYN